MNFSKLEFFKLLQVKKCSRGLGNYPHGLGNGQIWVHTPSHAEFDAEQDGRGLSAQQGPRKEEMSFLDVLWTRDSLLARIQIPGTGKAATAMALAS